MTTQSAAYMKARRIRLGQTTRIMISVAALTQILQECSTESITTLLSELEPEVQGALLNYKVPE